MESREIGFSYGCLCDELEKQANGKGFTLGSKAAEYEEARQAIHIITFAGISNDSQISSMFKKLHKKVISSLIPTDIDDPRKVKHQS